MHPIDRKPNVSQFEKIEIKEKKKGRVMGRNTQVFGNWSGITAFFRKKSRAGSSLGEPGPSTYEPGPSKPLQNRRVRKRTEEPSVGSAKNRMLKVEGIRKKDLVRSKEKIANQTEEDELTRQYLLHNADDLNKSGKDLVDIIRLVIDYRKGEKPQEQSHVNKKAKGKEKEVEHPLEFEAEEPESGELLSLSEDKGKEKETEKIEPLVLNEKTVRQILFTIISRAEAITGIPIDEKREENEDSEKNATLHDLHILIKNLKKIDDFRNLVNTDPGLVRLAAHASDATRQGKKILYLNGLKHLRDISETLAKASKEIHPRFYALRNKMVTLEKQVEACEKGVKLKELWGREPPWQYTGEGKQTFKKNLAETFDLITMAAENGIPTVFQLKQVKESEKGKEKEKQATASRNLLERLLALKDVPDLKKSAILRKKAESAEQAIANNKAVEPIPKFVSLERILMEVSCGNGVIAQQLIMSHKSNPKLANLIELLVSEAQYIHSLSELPEDRKKFLLQNIVRFLTEYVKIGASLPILRSEQLSLRDQLRSLSEILPEYDLSDLEYAIQNSPLAIPELPNEEEKKAIIFNLGVKENWPGHFQEALELLIKARNYGDYPMAKMVYGALEDALIERLEVKSTLSDFQWGLSLIEISTRLGMYRSAQQEKRLQDALNEAAQKLKMPYKIKVGQGKKLHKDLRALFYPLIANIHLGELDGGFWGKEGKEYLTPHIYQAIRWFDLVSSFLVKYILAGSNERVRRNRILTLVDAAYHALQGGDFVVMDCIMSALNRSFVDRLKILKANLYAHAMIVVEEEDRHSHNRVFSKVLQEHEIRGNEIVLNPGTLLGNLVSSFENTDKHKYFLCLDNLSTVTHLKDRYLTMIYFLKERPVLNQQRGKLAAAIEIADRLGDLSDEKFQDRTCEIQPLEEKEQKSAFSTEY